MYCNIIQLINSIKNELKNPRKLTLLFQVVQVSMRQAYQSKFGHTTLNCWHRFDEQYIKASFNPNSAKSNSASPQIQVGIVDSSTPVSALMAVPEILYNPA